MTITALPTPPSRSDDPAIFVSKADALMAALPQFVTEANATAQALNLVSVNDTSVTSNIIGTGAKTFTVSAGKSFQAGMYLVIADTAAPSTNSMFAQITSYSGTTLVVNVLSIVGSGTKTAWVISMTSAGGATLGANTFTGHQTMTTGDSFNESISTLASSATPDIWSAQSNIINYTGTVTATGFAAAPQAGVRRTLICAAACSFTAGANMLIDGGASFTAAAGDTVEVVAVTTTQFRLKIMRADGGAVVPDSKIISINATVATNALTLTINPTNLDFRSATLGSGVINTRNIASAISLVVSSGSTLGTVNAVQSRLAVLAIDNAGTVELAVVNVAGGISLDETGVINTTAEGGAGAADSINVIYSTTARTGVPYRVVGYIESTQATAGTWATAPSTIQGAGGQSLQRLNALCNGVPVTASGTAVDFTGIPSWAKRVLITLNSISLSATSVLLVQLGDAGGIENTGYLASSSLIAASVASTAFTTGFGLSSSSAAAYVYSGIVELCLVGGTTWVESASLGVSTGVTATALSGGTKTLSDVLTQIRVTTNGADTIDAGSINIIYE